MLALHGHDVLACVATGEDAISAATSLNPDLVLMDIHLKGHVDGIEAARRIRAGHDIPIIFLTAYSDREHLDRALVSEPSAYVLKPYSDRELLTTIEVVIHKHRLEAELRDRERWFGTTLRSIGDALIAVGRDQRIKLLNPEAERLTGWSNAEAIGKPADEILVLADERTGRSREVPLGRVIADGTIIALPGPTVLIGRDGRRWPVDGSVAAITDLGGVPHGVVILLRDITERRALDARLALTERVTSLTTLTAGLGHHLNNPLSYNLVNVELALAQVRALTTQLESVESAAHVVGSLREIATQLVDARDGAIRIRDVVGTLRTFARPIDDEPQLVSLVDVVAAALGVVENEVSLRGRPISTIRQRPSVRGHEGRLGQAFANLLINAAQALVDENSVRPQRITVVVDATDEDAIVEVTDTGVGIPSSVMARIFEPFFTTRSVGAGAGLGLAITHAVVQAHGGTIAVTSKVDEGTTFRVCLPRAEPLPRPVPSTLATPSRATILVVDDDVIVGRMLLRILEPHHDVVVTVSGREALVAIQDREPDVIVSDLMMPEMTGMQLHAQLLAERPALADRMLFVTGGAFTSATQAFVSHMGGRVIYKPMSPKDLLAAIAQIVRAWRP